MGKWIFVSASLLILVHVKQIKAQEKYTASNGIIYRVGDIVRLGKGSGDNGSFRFVYWGSSLIGDGNSCGSFMKMMILKEIKRLTPPFQDEPEIIFVVKGDDFMTYSLRIERAIHEVKQVRSRSHDFLTTTQKIGFNCFKAGLGDSEESFSLEFFESRALKEFRDFFRNKKSF